MRYPKSEDVGIALDPDGKQYILEFYGENEGAAVVKGSRTLNSDRMTVVSEIYRESAIDAADARQKLHAWARVRGWRLG
jgi:hypothetical protein